MALGCSGGVVVVRTCSVEYILNVYIELNMCMVMGICIFDVCVYENML